MEKTKIDEPGIELLEDGRYKIDTTATCPRTNKRKRRRYSCPPGTTLEEAIAIREQLKDEIRGVPQQEQQRLTLGGYAEAWIEQRADRLKPSTENFYRAALGNYLIPFLGDLYADVVIRADVAEYARWLEQQETEGGKPLAHSSMRSYWRASVTVLKDMAADIGIEDPTRRVPPPRGKRRNVKERRTLSLADLGRLVAWFKDHEDAKVRRRYAEVCVLAYTGLRSGELWALRPDSLEGEVLKIDASISGNEWTDVTKTGWSREVYAPPVVREAIVEHRRAMLGKPNAAAASGLLFPTCSGKPRTRGSLKKSLASASEELGLISVTPQVLRRTYNTLLVSAGVDRLVLRSQIGHSDEGMTEHYAGVRLESKKEAHEKVFNIKGCHAKT